MSDCRNSHLSAYDRAKMEDESRSKTFCGAKTHNVDADTYSEEKAAQDTREKLEADVREWVLKTVSPVRPVVNLRKIFDYLDRQDAITRAECDRPNLEYCETCDLQKQLDELTAANATLQSERDEYRAKLGRAVDMAHEIARLMEDA